MELSPEQRWAESLKHWATFLVIGGWLDDEPSPAELRRRRFGV